MHFILLKENFARALSIVNRSISNRPQLPILANILIKAKKGTIELSATNLDLGITINVPAKIENEGEITIPGKLLTEFINSLSTDKIDINQEENNLIVKTGKTKATFATVSAADFPPFPQLPEKQKTFPLKNLKEAILRVVFAASNDETRPILTGVKTTITEGIITLTATDGYRLSIEKVELTDKKETLSAVLPASSLLEVMRVATELKVEEVGVGVIENKNQIVFTLPNVSIYTRLIDGEFPNIEKIIPTEFKTKVIVDRELFFQAVKTTSLFAKNAANIIKIKIGKDKLHLSANTPQVGSDEDIVEAKVDGEETEIAFNFRFLSDILTNMPDKEVVFETSGSLAPGVFKPAGGKISFLHLIMPVRVQG